MDIKKYFDKVNKKIDNLTDEEFDQLLIDCGIEKYPHEECPDIDIDFKKIDKNKFQSLMIKKHDVERW